jgi:hypothetical protein
MHDQSIAIFNLVKCQEQVMFVRDKYKFSTTGVSTSFQDPTNPILGNPFLKHQRKIYLIVFDASTTMIRHKYHIKIYVDILLAFLSLPKY